MKSFFCLFLILFSLHMHAAVYQSPTPQFRPRAEIATVYIEYKGKILLLHRQENKTQGNRWGIPGGKVDKGEMPLQAVIREIKEETGYDISGQIIENLGTVYVEHDER